MSIESIKHNKETRPLIPSSEEAGTEAASPVVLSGQAVAQYPKNPVVHRGQDPELFWMDKYGQDDLDDLVKVDIRSLYRHEHIAPETLISRLYQIKETEPAQLDLAGMFGSAIEMDELEKVGSYYSHPDGWKNRLIQGDSLLVMVSLLEREGMAGKVQCIYIDPPYGIKYGSNWQMRLNNRNVKDGDDDDLSGEPEQIKAYRDTWELGIHSYLSYLRDRLLVAHDLLTETGSCFVQISDENVHLVRCIMDEVFGSENFVALIPFRKKTMPLGSQYLESVNDYLVWYGKDKTQTKYRKLYQLMNVEGDSHWNYVELADGTRRKMTREEINSHKLLPSGSVVCQLMSLYPVGQNSSGVFPLEVKGKLYDPPSGKSWFTNEDNMKRLVAAGRVEPYEDGSTIRYVLKLSDGAISALTGMWHDTSAPAGMEYAVETSRKVVQRCVLMTTDPGDLVLDPTCGGGTTARVAEQWGRRWIAIDTSRIALNIAKTRLMRDTFHYYRLHDEVGHDIRQGFVYRKVPMVTRGSIANAEPPEEATLYDQPEVDKKKLRVAGPFTVETLQNFEPVSPEALDQEIPESGELEQFEERVFEHLKSAGVKTGIKEECAVFIRIQRLSHAQLHAEGFYQAANGERKAYLHIGPKFGTVSRQAVNEAVKECRARGDADWLIILGFSFESDISSETVTTSLGSFKVTKARMHDDLMQDGLLKRDKKAASFVTIGEPDICLHREGNSATVEICGLDIYDPIMDDVKSRNVADIGYWMVDDDYDGSNFIVRQVFFCGGDKDEFDKWKKGLSNLAVASAKRRAEKTLKIDIDDDAFSRVYGHKSHPIAINRPDQKIAVRVISQFGEECTKVLGV